MTYPELFFQAHGRFSRAQYWIGLGFCIFLHVVIKAEYTFLAVTSPLNGFDGLAWLAMPLAWVLRAYIVYLVATTHLRRCHDLDVIGVVGVFALVTIVGIPVIMTICG